VASWPFYSGTENRPPLKQGKLGYTQLVEYKTVSKGLNQSSSRFFPGFQTDCRTAFSWSDPPWQNGPLAGSFPVSRRTAGQLFHGLILLVRTDPWSVPVRFPGGLPDGFPDCFFMV